MAITECGRGHVYDNDRYAFCPYCNGGGNMINFDNVGQGAAGRTTAPAGFGGFGGQTVAPANLGGGTSADMAGRTVAPSGYGNGSPVNVGAGFAPEPGKTVAPESVRRRMENENKTVAVFKQKYDLDPVVGWLVCVEGADKGRDFRIMSRINTIGRSENMDICIKSDMTVSKENHARLAYDPKHNDFRLIPGTSVNNIYINDEPVYVPTKIVSYDLIELGDSKFVFISLCNEQFDWAEGVKK